MFFETWYVGLNENVLHRLICLNIWSLVGGTIWEGLGGVALLQEVYHQWLQKTHDIPSVPLRLLLAEDTGSRQFAIVKRFIL